MEALKAELNHLQMTKQSRSRVLTPWSIWLRRGLKNIRLIIPMSQLKCRVGALGVGISSLIQGLADMANASRKMKDKEKARAESELGVAPIEYVVGQDALAVYVHKDNPLEEITLSQLESIYADGGTISKWSELDIELPGGSDEIVRVSRQNNSGTYAYFREAVLKDNDFKLGSIDLSGSSDVVSMVEKTASAIGYSGMGYATDNVKMLKIKSTDDGDAVALTADNVINGTYPLRDR